MSKILVLGDIHGRLIWMDIIQKENPDKVVFLGDYVSTHEDIPAEQQLSNLEDILNYKEKLGNDVVLLRGNHDEQHLGYYWAECSGFDRKVWEGMKSIKDRFEKLTQWIHTEGTLLFSHAGVSQVWLDNNELTIDSINAQEPSEIFGFTPDSMFDYYGNSVTQPPTWIRPQSLVKCNVLGYTQVVGHTPVSKEIVNVSKAAKFNQDIWLCDALGLGQYLVIVDNKFQIGKV